MIFLGRIEDTKKPRRTRGLLVVEKRRSSVFRCHRSAAPVEAIDERSADRLNPGFEGNTVPVGARVALDSPAIFVWSKKAVRYSVFINQPGAEMPKIFSFFPPPPPINQPARSKPS